MSNIRNEQRALRDEQRAAIKAAVAHANAIIQPVLFPARRKAAERRPCPDGHGRHWARVEPQPLTRDRRGPE
jgi:hypothetical protein